LQFRQISSEIFLKVREEWEIQRGENRPDF
jgi:hypothetical protein